MSVALHYNENGQSLFSSDDAAHVIGLPPSKAPIEGRLLDMRIAVLTASKSASEDTTWWRFFVLSRPTWDLLRVKRVSDAPVLFGDEVYIGEKDAYFAFRVASKKTPSIYDWNFQERWVEPLIAQPTPGIALVDLIDKARAAVIGKKMIRKMLGLDPKDPP